MKHLLRCAAMMVCFVTVRSEARPAPRNSSSGKSSARNSVGEPATRPAERTASTQPTKATESSGVFSLIEDSFLFPINLVPPPPKDGFKIAGAVPLRLERDGGEHSEAWFV